MKTTQIMASVWLTALIFQALATHGLWTDAESLEHLHELNYRKAKCILMLDTVFANVLHGWSLPGKKIIVHFEDSTAA